MPYGEVSDWFIDGMAAIMAVKVKETWQEYAHSFLEYCMPKNTSKVGKLFIVFDSYRNSSIKQLTQLRRGTPGETYYQYKTKNAKIWRLEQFFEKWAQQN